jgi:hypothetical protein
MFFQVYSVEIGSREQVYVIPEQQPRCFHLSLCFVCPAFRSSNIRRLIAREQRLLPASPGIISLQPTTTIPRSTLAYPFDIVAKRIVSLYKLPLSSKSLSATPFRNCPKQGLPNAKLLFGLGKIRNAREGITAIEQDV